MRLASGWSIENESRVYFAVSTGWSAPSRPKGRLPETECTRKRWSWSTSSTLRAPPPTDARADVELVLMSAAFEKSHASPNTSVA